MSTKNPERARHWNGVLNTCLQEIVDCHKKEPGCFPNNEELARQLIGSAVQEARFLGFEQHPFIKRMEGRYLHPGNTRLGPMLRRFAEEVYCLPGQHKCQFDAIQSLARTFIQVRRQV